MLGEGLCPSRLRSSACGSPSSVSTLSSATDGRWGCRSTGIPAWCLLLPSSDRTGGSSARARVSPGPTWTRRSRSRTCSASAIRARPTTHAQGWKSRDHARTERSPAVGGADPARTHTLRASRAAGWGSAPTTAARGRPQRPASVPVATRPRRAVALILGVGLRMCDPIGWWSPSSGGVPRLW